MDRIECSVWNNGGNGWGLRVLGGPQVRRLHFRRKQSPIHVELGGTLFPFNINKKSFWTPNCGELIKVPLRNWIVRNGLRSGDRVWLEILEPHQTFRAVLAASTLPMKESA
jgi:hypothetical protein